MFPPPGAEDQRFLTTIVMLLVLERTKRLPPGLSRGRVAPFLRALHRSIGAQALQIAAQPLVHVLCNRFATGQFEVDVLLGDFREVLASVPCGFNFPDVVSAFLAQGFAALLDTEMINRVLANPARFTFSNAIMWNSFVTAFESVQPLRLGNVRQAACALVMAGNLTDPCADEDVRRAVCADLDKRLIVFLISNFRPDAMMEEAVDASAVARRWHVDMSNLVSAVHPQAVADFRASFRGGLDVCAWRRVRISPALVREFPCFREIAQVE